MRLARILHRRALFPRLALERDGFFYDVEALEDALGAAVPVPGSPSSFRARVVALGLAGLRELDQRVLRGERPRAAAIEPLEAALLAPFDAESSAHFHLSRSASVSPTIGLSRAVLGHRGFIGASADRGQVRPGIGYVLGEDLHRATLKEVRGAFAGITLTLHWEGFAEHPITQAGPVLVTSSELKLRDAVMTLRSPRRAQTLSFTQDTLEAMDRRVVQLAEEFELRGGDLLSFEAGLVEEAAVHELMSVEIPTLELSGTAAPRRPRDRDSS